MAIQNEDLLIAYRPSEQKHYKVNVSAFSSGDSPWTSNSDNIYPVDFSKDVLIGGTLPAAPNISLKNTGAATFAGTVAIGDNPGAPNEAGARIYSSGSIAVSRGTDQTNRAFGVLDKNGSPTVELFPSGSATFAGSISADSMDCGIYA